MTGPELKRLRLACGLSGSKMAKTLGVTLRTVWRLEAMRGKVPKIYELAARQIESLGRGESDH